MKLLKEPLLQFLVIGACIYGAYALYGPIDEEQQQRIVQVDAGQIDAFISGWEKRWNRPPTRQELNGLIDNYVRETILYRQAVAMGLDQGDPITRRRMAQKLEFLTNDLALLKEPTEAELNQFFVDHEQRYREPDLLTLSHAFFNPDARDEKTLDDAAAALESLREAGVPDPHSLEAGDRFMLESYYAEVTQAEIRRRFGSGFSEAVVQLAPEQWHGPVLSGYGVHLVYIYRVEKAPAPVFDAVRERVVSDWQTQQQETFNAQFIEQLKASYDIEIAELPLDRVLDDRAEVEAGAASAADSGSAS